MFDFSKGCYRNEKEEHEVRKIVSGNFLEGEYVVVNIDGNVVMRKVRYSGRAGDLYVVCKNMEYYLNEFE